MWVLEGQEVTILTKGMLSTLCHAPLSVLHLVLLLLGPLFLLREILNHAVRAIRSYGLVSLQALRDSACVVATTNCFLFLLTVLHIIVTVRRRPELLNGPVIDEVEFEAALVIEVAEEAS